MTDSILSWISLIVFILTIVVGIRRKVNLGILAIAVSFILGFFSRTDPAHRR